MKLLGEDKVVQYYWDWFKSSDTKDHPWELHPKDSNTNSVHEDNAMRYPPENPTLVKQNNKSILVNVAIRVLIPIGLVFLIIL